MDLVFDEIRLAARGQPWVLITLLQEIQALALHMKVQGLDERLHALLAQAKLTGEVAQASLDVSGDKDRVQKMVDAVLGIGLTSAGSQTHEVEENAAVDVRG